MRKSDVFAYEKNQTDYVRLTAIYALILTPGV